MVAENRQGVSSYGSGRHVKKRRCQFTGDLEHVGYHQEKTLEMLVKVVVRQPVVSAPCTAPEAPPSDCISTTVGIVPKCSFHLPPTWRQNFSPMSDTG